MSQLLFILFPAQTWRRMYTPRVIIGLFGAITWNDDDVSPITQLTQYLNNIVFSQRKFSAKISTHDLIPMLWVF